MELFLIDGDFMSKFTTTSGGRAWDRDKQIIEF